MVLVAGVVVGTANRWPALRRAPGADTEKAEADEISFYREEDQKMRRR